MQRITVCAAVADWILERRDLVRRVWAAWLLAHACAMRGYLEAEVTRLVHRLGKKKESIWEMRKPALVEQAMRRLGWTRDQAEAETVGQLRLYLKELNEAEKVENVLLPKGLARMKLGELQAECEARGIEIMHGKKNLTREELIRELRRWASLSPKQAQEAPSHEPSTTSSGAGARPKVRPDVRQFKPAGRARRPRAMEGDFEMLGAEDGMTDSD